MVNINKLIKSSILAYFIGQFILLDFGKDSYLPIYVYSPTIVRSDQHILELNDIRQYMNHQPNVLLDKNRIERGNKYVTITTTNCALKEDWKSYVVNTLPDLNDMPNPNVNGIMTEEQAKLVENAMNNAQNRRSDKQQFRENDVPNNSNNSKQQKSRSANNSPILQPQIPQSDIDIIPIISVSQHSLNQQQPINAFEYIDQVKMMDHLHDDRFKILLETLLIRVEQYNKESCNDIAMYMMNYDHIQIIAALNKDDLFFKFISNIMLVYNHIKDKPEDYKQKISLWDDYVGNFDKSTLNMMNRNSLMKELKEFDTQYRKKHYLKSIVMNYIRQIDYLRVFQIADRLGNIECAKLMDLCCNADIFINQVKICQNMVHQEVREMGIKIVRENIIEELQQDINEQKDELKDEEKDKQNDLQQQQGLQQNQLQQQGSQQDQSQVQRQQPSQVANSSPSPMGTLPSQQQSQQQHQNDGSQPDVPANFNVNNELNDINDTQSQDYKLIELSKSTEKALLESWLDKAYSHLRTFQYDGPTFSNHTELFDNSAKTTTTSLQTKIFYVVQLTRS